MFLESWSNDHELIINNAKDIGSTSPDYENFEPHVAEADFLERIRQYERFYEPLDPQKIRIWRSLSWSILLKK